MQACTSKKALVIVILVCWLLGPVRAGNINISDKDKELPAEYCSMQLMTDYICGMTDTFACILHKRLTNG